MCYVNHTCAHPTCTYIQLSELSFELAHQRVQLQGKLAEAGNKVALVREEMKNKVRQFMYMYVCLW